jgi:hypothetical protein
LKFIDTKQKYYDGSFEPKCKIANTEYYVSSSSWLDHPCGGGYTDIIEVGIYNNDTSNPVFKYYKERTYGLGSHNHVGVEIEDGFQQVIENLREKIKMELQ